MAAVRSVTMTNTHHLMQFGSILYRPMTAFTRRQFLEAAGLTAAAPALDAVAGQGPVTAGAITVEKDVVFGKGDAMDLRCDLYRPPTGTSKRAATIHIHGGGFTGGNKETLTERIRPFAANGYLAIAAQYRLLGQSPWPAMLDDVKAAIRWTRTNAARLGIDPARIIVVGYSAGGHLALTANGTQNRQEFEGSGGSAGAGTQVAACIAYYPVVDGGPPPSASPATYVAANASPTVLFHGVADTTVPIESSQRFFQLLRDKKVPAEFHSFAGQPHIFDREPAFAVACAQLADLFIARNGKT
jgi:acetyl esterase/lipase